MEAVMAKPQARPRPLTTIASYPNHLRAIGMFVAEFNVLEMSLGEFLGSLLHIDKENGKILYLTPHTGYGRISILENLASDGKHLFKKDSASQKDLLALLTRARKAMDRRHKIVHDSWGVASNSVQSLVARQSMPFLSGRSFTPVPLNDLRRYITDLRNLIQDVRALTNGGYETWPPYTSRPIPPPPSRRGRTRTPDGTQTKTAAKPKSRPRL
jgi:hypothetical protein